MRQNSYIKGATRIYVKAVNGNFRILGYLFVLYSHPDMVCRLSQMFLYVYQRTDTTFDSVMLIGSCTGRYPWNYFSVVILSESVLENRQYRPGTMTNTRVTSLMAQLLRLTKTGIVTVQPALYSTWRAACLGACSDSKQWKLNAITERHQTTWKHNVQRRYTLISLPVRTIWSSWRNTINADIGFHAQERLVLPPSRHLDSDVMDAGVVAVTRLSSSPLWGASCVRECVRAQYAAKQ